MIDSRLPRFSQAVQAVLIAVAYVLEIEWLVVVVAALLVLAAVGGPQLNLFAYVYRALPIPPGELEPAAPPRFSQTLGAVFLTISSVALYTLRSGTTALSVLGWGPAIVVAVLAALAATTSF